MSHDTVQASFISTQWGRVRVHSLGDPKAPLVLAVHGSGSGSSSKDWLILMFETVLRSPQPLHFAAFDCPGYGESEGSKQIVRSYPTQLVRAVIAALGKKSALSLVGHSQGSACIFNCAMEDASITAKLIQDRPVPPHCKIEALSQLKMPVLLAFDEEDDGHPVSKGRRMAKALPNNRFISWKSSEQPDFYSDNFVTEILDFLFDGSGGKPKARAKASAGAGAGAGVRVRSESKSPVRQRTSPARERKEESGGSPKREERERKDSKSPTRCAPGAGGAGAGAGASSSAPGVQAAKMTARDAEWTKNLEAHIAGGFGGGGAAAPAAAAPAPLAVVGTAAGSAKPAAAADGKSADKSPAAAGPAPRSPRQTAKSESAAPRPKSPAQRPKSPSRTSAAAKPQAAQPPPVSLADKIHFSSLSVKNSELGRASLADVPAASDLRTAPSAASRSPAAGASPSAAAGAGVASTSSAGAEVKTSSEQPAAAALSDAKAETKRSSSGSDAKATAGSGDDDADAQWARADVEVAAKPVSAGAGAGAGAAGGSSPAAAADASFDCPLCMSVLFDPITTPCSHSFCLKCLKDAVLYNPRCPMCRGDLQEFKFSAKAVDKELEAKAKASVPAAEWEKRVKTLEADEKRRASSVRGKKRYTWTLFARVVKTAELAALPRFSAAKLIDRVEFDINPGVPKGSIFVDRSPFELERSGTYEFDCNVVVYWAARFKRDPTTVSHHISFAQAKNARRFVETFNASLFA